MDNNRAHPRAERVGEEIPPIKAASEESLTVGELLDAIASVIGVPSQAIDPELAKARIYLADGFGGVAMASAVSEVMVDDTFGELPPLVYVNTGEGDNGPMVCVPHGAGSAFHLLKQLWNDAVESAFGRGAGFDEDYTQVFGMWRKVDIAEATLGALRDQMAAIDPETLDPVRRDVLAHRLRDVGWTGELLLGS